MRIDIWSDLVCPWCYLGETRLERAIGSLGWRDEVTLRMRAYQLDPRADRGPQDLAALIDRKYGPGAFQAMVRRFDALGGAEGLEYRFDRARRSSTVDAHRLVTWASQDDPASGVQLTHRLFRAYFTEGVDLGDPDELARLAGEADLSVAHARRVLDGSDFADQVAADQDEALEHGIAGVPAFVIEGQWVLTGAQEVATFVRVLERAGERLTGE